MRTEVFTGDGLLRGNLIFLSASKPSREPELFPVADRASVEIEEAVRALARAVFAEGGRLVSGAHPSISPLIVDVATEYFPPRWEGARENPPVLIYQSEAFADVIPPATYRLQDLGYARIVMTGARNEERFVAGFPREQCLGSLAHMRARMFEETRPVAMVAIGGMQGVVRETRLFLDMFQTNRVYMMRTLGGAAERLLAYLAENSFGELKPSGHWRDRVVALEDRYGSFNWDACRNRGTTRLPYALLMQRMVREITGAEN